MKRILQGILAGLILLCLSHPLFAGTQGHYFPGVLNIRDFALPYEGVYISAYDPVYSADEFYGADSKKLESIGVAKTIDVRGFKLNLTGAVDFEKASLHSSGSSLTCIWVPKGKILGANFGFFVAPYVGYVNAKLEAKAKITGVNDIVLPDGRTVGSVDINQTDSGFGDVFVRPVWLGWHAERFDISASYSFYAPSGHYDNKSLANMGFGFWSHEIALGGLYYVNKSKATALMLNATYEFNSEQQGTDVTPGQYLTLEYGLSQYLSERFEVGVSGYSLYQTKKDSGESPMQTLSYVNGVGGQATYWLIKHKLGISGRYTYEYAARGRFKGSVAAINCAYVF